MNVRGATRGFLLFLLTVPVIQGQDVSSAGWGVTCNSERVCLSRGSTVHIYCTYEYPPDLVHNVTRRSWWTESSAEDLIEDSQYAGRVQYQYDDVDRSATLTIADLRESDDSVYRFRFITNVPGGEYNGPIDGVTLAVKDYCESDTDYTVKPPDESRDDLWGVTYDSNSVCAIKGSTVKMISTYKYPSSYTVRVHHRSYSDSSFFHQRHDTGYYTYDTVNADVINSFWFTKETDRAPVDLYRLSLYAGRVQYHCVKQRCTLSITDLRENDSAEYMFRFITNIRDRGKYDGKPGVTLGVTDFRVTMTPSTVIEGQTVTLTCDTTITNCRLKDRPAYVWYHNGQKMEHAEGQRMVVGPVISTHAGKYSCAVSGREDVRAPERALTVR